MKSTKSTPRNPGHISRCHEHLPSGRGRAAASQIASDGVTDIDRQWKPIEALALAADLDLPGPPVDVLQTQSRHRAGAQAQPQQDVSSGTGTV